MAYLGNDLQVAYPTYKNIDDISGSFNSSTTSFPLRVNGVAPVPPPLNSQQCLISVGGVVQRPDDSGSEGFRLSGGNIIFASAPTTGADFFGVILAGADYINVGANFPSGTAAVPSITFDSDLDTGIFNAAANEIGFATGGVQRFHINSAGQLNNNLGTAGAPSYSFTGDLNTGIYSPGADQVAISTGGSGRLFVNQARTGVNISPTAFQLQVNENSGAASYVHITNSDTGTTGSDGALVGLDSDENLIVWNQEAKDLRLATSGQERLRITSAGLVGIGTSSPGGLLELSSNASGTLNGEVLLQRIRSNTSNTTFVDIKSRRHTAGTSWEGVGFRLQHQVDGTPMGFLEFNSLNGGQDVAIGTGGATRVLVDSSGRVGIGTTSPGYTLSVSGNNGTDVALVNATAGTIYFGAVGNKPISFENNGTEKARIDSSGRLLVGTSSARAPLSALGSPFQVEGTSINTAGISVTRSSNDADGPALWIAKNRGGLGGNGTVINGDGLGSVIFTGNNGSDQIQAASISAFADGAVSGGGAGDLPGRLVFSTTEDGTSSPTERVRITNNGNFYIGQSASATPGLGNTNLGVSFENTDGGSSRALWISRSAGAVAGFNRNTDDGTLVSLRQAGTEEGSISVSGTTVSYNGAHLSRWSQLPSGAERTEILRGSVLSNIDEMCEWPDEDNEQLNRMKVSDVEGDKNVSGVFQAWDDDDDTYTNDFYCAMTGDFIIRIGAGVTVERGDLLMSAGDGTAKPQDDDIIRSKTIAKVTSTNVSCTYEDGSYCVPCVLMAC